MTAAWCQRHVPSALLLVGCRPSDILFPFSNTEGDSLHKLRILTYAGLNILVAFHTGPEQFAVFCLLAP